MLGLILKDLYTVKKSILYVVVITVVFGVVYSGSSAAFSVAGVMASTMVVSITSTTISYDEYYHWDRYAATLPMGRRQIITAKYLLILMMVVSASLISLTLGWAFGTFLGDGVDWVTLFASMGSSLFAGILGAAVVTPLYYRFGVQQCRFALVAVYGIPALAVVLWLRLTGATITEAQLEAIIPGLLLAVSAICLVAMAVSYLIAVRIYKKKELK